MSAGLLARLGTQADEPIARVTDPAAAIEVHLRALLGSRPGGSPSSPGFGLADLSDAVHSYPAGAQRIAARIRAVIEAYEPRLARGIAVDLFTAEEGLALSYRLSARLHSDRRVLLTFRVDVSPGGVDLEPM